MVRQHPAAHLRRKCGVENRGPDRLCRGDRSARLRPCPELPRQDSCEFSDPRRGPRFL